MSIYHQQFILHGYRFSFDQYVEHIQDTEFDERYNPYNRILQKGDIVLLADGQAGNYCFLGAIQFVSGKSQMIQPINPPQKIESPDPQAALGLGQVVEKCPIELPNEYQPYVLTHTT